MPVKLSVGVTGHPYLLESDGLFTEGWRPGRTFGKSVGVIFALDCSDWSNSLPYHKFDTRPDTEFKSINEGENALDDVAGSVSQDLPSGRRHGSSPCTMKSMRCFVNSSSMNASLQGLTLVHVRAQLSQLQDTLTS
jgi:hypothetical protein